MVVVSVSETYDLHTLPNKMSLIGIKTPPVGFIRKMYPGLFMQCKMMRFLECDVQMACASILPADPQQIGVEAGDIAPQDMFNPILYKAVSNDSMSLLEQRLCGLLSDASAGLSVTLEGPSVIADNNLVTGQSDEFMAYYGLLSNREGFRTANPQAGLSMRGLRPMVFEKLYMYGVNQGQDVDNVTALGVTAQGGVGNVQVVNHTMRGKRQPMPWFNTTYASSYNDNQITGFVAGSAGSDGSPVPANNQAATPQIGSCFVSAIVMPPAKLNQLYYRMVVRWKVEFSGIRPISEITSLAGLPLVGQLTYNSDYTFGQTLQSKSIQDVGSVSSMDASIEKIMEGH